MVGIKPKPQFMGLFQFMDTHSGSPTTSENKSPEPDDGSELALTGWWRRGRLQLLIPYFLCREHSGKKGSVFRLRFDIDELFAVNGDPPEYLPDQGLPLLVCHAGV